MPLAPTRSCPAPTPPVHGAGGPLEEGDGEPGMERRAGAVPREQDRSGVRFQRQRARPAVDEVRREAMGRGSLGVVEEALQPVDGPQGRPPIQAMLQLGLRRVQEARRAPLGQEAGSPPAGRRPSGTSGDPAPGVPLPGRRR